MKGGMDKLKGVGSAVAGAASAAGGAVGEGFKNFKKKMSKTVDPLIDSSLFELRDERIDFKTKNSTVYNHKDCLEASIAAADIYNYEYYKDIEKQQVLDEIIVGFTGTGEDRGSVWGFPNSDYYEKEKEYHNILFVRIVMEKFNDPNLFDDDKITEFLFGIFSRSHDDISDIGDTSVINPELLEGLKELNTNYDSLVKVIKDQDKEIALSKYEDIKDIYSTTNYNIWSFNRFNNIESPILLNSNGNYSVINTEREPDGKVLYDYNDIFLYELKEEDGNPMKGYSCNSPDDVKKIFIGLFTRIPPGNFKICSYHKYHPKSSDYEFYHVFLLIVSQSGDLILFDPKMRKYNTNSEILNGFHFGHEEDDNPNEKIFYQHMWNEDEWWEIYKKMVENGEKDIKFSTMDDLSESPSLLEHLKNIESGNINEEDRGNIERVTNKLNGIDCMNLRNDIPEGQDFNIYKVFNEWNEGTTMTRGEDMEPEPAPDELYK